MYSLLVKRSALPWFLSVSVSPSSVDGDRMWRQRWGCSPRLSICTDDAAEQNLCITHLSYLLFVSSQFKIIICCWVKLSSPWPCHTVWSHGLRCRQKSLKLTIVENSFVSCFNKPPLKHVCDLFLWNTQPNVCFCLSLVTVGASVSDLLGDKQIIYFQLNAPSCMNTSVSLWFWITEASGDGNRTSYMAPYVLALSLTLCPLR